MTKEKVVGEARRLKKEANQGGCAPGIQNVGGQKKHGQKKKKTTSKVEGQEPRQEGLEKGRGVIADDSKIGARRAARRTRGSMQ